MACLASYNGCCRCGSGCDRHSSRPRAAQGDYALVPLNHSHRADRPLRDYIADDNALDSARGLRPGRVFSGVQDPAAIDRDGPYGYHLHSPRCRSLPHIYEDYLDLPDPNWRFSYIYPLPGMEAGRVRWSSDQIRAYNRDVLRHNGQIARRKAASVPGEYMMLHPMMDPHGRFPPGFDRPVGIEDFFGWEGKWHSHLFLNAIIQNPSQIFVSATLCTTSITCSPVSQNLSLTATATTMACHCQKTWNVYSSSTPLSKISDANSNGSSSSSTTVPDAWPNNLVCNYLQHRTLFPG